MAYLVKMLIAVGSVMIVTGVLLYLLGRVPGMGRLPGDFLIKKENFTFYFPFATCVVLSLIISLIIYIWNHR